MTARDPGAALLKVGDLASLAGVSVRTLHHYEEIHQHPEQQRQRFYAIWEQIAERYASRPAQVAFEVHSAAQGANSAFQLLGDREAFARARAAIDRLLARRA